MVPSLLVALLYGDGDAGALLLSILAILAISLPLMSLKP